MCYMILAQLLHQAQGDKESNSTSSYSKNTYTMCKKTATYFHSLELMNIVKTVCWKNVMKENQTTLKRWDKTKLTLPTPGAGSPVGLGHGITTFTRLPEKLVRKTEIKKNYLM